jgi:hypothetical protein
MFNRLTLKTVVYILHVQMHLPNKWPESETMNDKDKVAVHIYIIYIYEEIIIENFHNFIYIVYVKGFT